MHFPDFPAKVRPYLHILHPEQIAEVHRFSIQILEETGLKVESKDALDIFRKSDAVQVKNDVVYIRGELINHAIDLAPSNIEIFNRSGEFAFHLGEHQGDETHFGIGVTNTWFQDIETGDVELFTRKHMQHSTSLGNILPGYAMVSTPGIPSDVSAAESDLYSALDMYANTEKPLVLLISGEDKINPVFELLNFLQGDISTKPFCIPYVNPISPLVLNKDTSDKMIASLGQDLPLMYSNYGMYGGTSPVTEGGTLALLNAELLAGLVFSQLIKEGSKLIMGSLPAAFNMSTMGSNYTPVSYILNLASAEMMKHYKIPHCGTSGSNNGRGADLIADGNLWLNHLTACLGKVGCSPFVGGNFGSMAFSPATVVLSNQIIAEARQFAAGFTISEKTVNVEEINHVGHGGNFFTSEQTLESIQSLGDLPEIWPSMSLAAWKEQQQPTAQEALTDHAKTLYTKAISESEEHMEIVKRGEAFIRNSLI